MIAPGKTVEWSFVKQGRVVLRKSATEVVADTLGLELKADFWCFSRDEEPILLDEKKRKLEKSR